MTTMRKVMLNIEVDTCLTVEELKSIQALVFGRLRSDKHAKEQRRTIKLVMPAGLNHDVRGTIVQVQANVMKETRASKKAAKNLAAVS